MVRHPTLPALLALALLAFPAAAPAWSGLGHQVVAAIADERLGPAARAMVAELTGGAPLSAGDLATWADAHRTEADAPWHYVNIPFGAPYRAERDCPEGGCAVEAVLRKRAFLLTAHPVAERGSALRWLVHLVGDLHQPLHAGSSLDRGGNQQRVRVERRRQPTSLHAVWDDEVVEALARGRPPRALARALLQGASRAQLEAWAEVQDPVAWAQESSRAARAIYADLDLTPQGHAPRPRSQPLPLVSGPILARWGEAAGPALLRAGVRLAALLDEVARARASPGGAPPSAGPSTARSRR